MQTFKSSQPPSQRDIGCIKNSLTMNKTWWYSFSYNIQNYLTRSWTPTKTLKPRTSCGKTWARSWPRKCQNWSYGTSQHSCVWTHTQNEDKVWVCGHDLVGEATVDRDHFKFLKSHVIHQICRPMDFLSFLYLHKAVICASINQLRGLHGFNIHCAAIRFKHHHNHSTCHTLCKSQMWWS